MRRSVIIGLLLLVMVQGAFAGGILTNTNQSVQFTRMLARNASTDIDAVYFNPAGITQLADGFHFALHNQTISQGRIVTSTFSYLNREKYEGDTFVPVFPNLYAVYKKEKMAFALGFGPIAGGGSAEFKNGLPDLEMPLSLIPLSIRAAGIPTSAYSVDLAFEGVSIIYGIQFSTAYALSEKVSVSVGARYNIASNTYEGSLKNVMVNPNAPALGLGGTLIPATNFFTAIGDPVTAMGLSDQEVDAKQSGNGITPIIGLNIKPSRCLNIGLKYEMATKMEIENETQKDLIAMPQFEDGRKMRKDLPAILAAGVSYRVSDPLLISVGGNLYFDKDANWEGREKLVDSNLWEMQIGAQYAVSENIKVSAGFQHTANGVSDMYQTGLDYFVGANAIGAGARIGLGGALALELGGLYTMYQPHEVDRVYPGVPDPNYQVTFDKTAWLLSVGLEYAIRK